MNVNKISKEKLIEKLKDAASSKSGRIHIVQRSGQWSVKKEGINRSIAVKATKAEALKIANSIKVIDCVIIHKKDGTILKKLKGKSHGTK